MSVRQGETVRSCCARMHAAHENEKRLMRVELEALRVEVERLTEAVRGLTEDPAPPK